MTSNYSCQIGDIGLVQISGNVGKAISIGQWLDGDGYEIWSHAFIVVDVTPEAVYIVQAEPGGATYVELDYADIWWCEGISHNLTEDQRTAIAADACHYIGVGYSFADYFALAAHRLRIPAPGLKRFVETSKHMICSQLVDQAYHDGGVDIFEDGRWPGDVTPGDLYKQDLLLRVKYNIGV